MSISASGVGWRITLTLLAALIASIAALGWGAG